MNILIVDDDPAVGELVAAVLRKLCANISMVQTFREAKAYLTSKMVDLVLLDIGLPDSLAEDTITRVSELRDGHNKIVIVTGAWPPSASLTPAQSGADAVIYKGDADIIPKLEALCAK
jgi:DNA-binding response OmpR family regulator